MCKSTIIPVRKRENINMLQIIIVMACLLLYMSITLVKKEAE
jgi:hypothetical protein